MSVICLCAGKEDYITIYFLRHGESQTNAIGDTIMWNLGFPKVLDLDPLETVRNFGISGSTRITVDSPLSDFGHQQARKLGVNMFRNQNQVCPDRDHVTELINSGNALLAVSNLSRTQQTLANFLVQRPRSRRKAPVKIQILNCLQEVAENVSALTSKAGTDDPHEAVPFLLRTDDFVWEFPRGTTQVTDYNWLGTRKSLSSRFHEFIRWLRESDKSTVIVAGHSQWLLEFFRIKMIQPQNDIEAYLRMVKIDNAAMIKFNFDFNTGEIEPNSTVLACHYDFSKMETIEDYGFQKVELTDV